MSQTLRSFIAVDIDRETFISISSFQKTLSGIGAHLKLVDPENIHITLRFLGEIPFHLAERIGDELMTLQFSPFEASLQGTGVFPNERRINVIWIGIGDGISELREMHHQINSKLSWLKIGSNNRRFNPHLTIARVRSAKNRNKIVEVIRASREQKFGTFQIDSVKLKKSVLTPKGPIYTTLRKVKASP